MSESGRHRSSTHDCWYTLVALCAVLLLSGCAGVIVPPANPPTPTSVFVLDHGRHSSLVLPLETGLVRYSYGDWDYYALDRTGLARGLRALFRPTAAALGQQVIPPSADIDAIRQHLRIEIVSGLEIRVDADAVRRLRDKLGTLFDTASHTRHHSPVYDVHFVRHPEPYTLRHNSNRMVGRWLEQLGCTVRGSQILSRWSLADTDR